MNANDKIRIVGFDATSTEDDYSNGCSTRPSSHWDESDIQIDSNRLYDSVKEALEAVCRANFFKFRPENWTAVEGGSRFEGSFMVDAGNNEADEDEIERWRQGETRLWECIVTARLVVATERGLTDEELVLS